MTAPTRPVAPTTTPNPNHQKLMRMVTQQQQNHMTSCQRAANHRWATTVSLAAVFAIESSLHER